MASCSMPNCDRPVIARSLCAAHYQRQRRSGELEVGTGEPITTPDDTFEAMLGKGWLLASEVAELVGCSERSARRMLTELVHQGRAHCLSSGEGSLWEVLPEPGAALGEALERIVTEASSGLVRSARAPDHLRRILTAAKSAQSAMERLLRPRLVLETGGEHG